MLPKRSRNSPAGDLRQSIGPGEGGEEDSRDRRVNPQLSGELWGGDPQYGAIEIVDHGANGQQRKNADAPPERRTVTAGWVEPSG